MATDQRSSANGMPAVGVREGIEVNEFEFNGIPIPIPIPIPMELASIVMCRTVSTEPTPIPMHAPIPMPMGTVPILAPTSVLIRCNLTSFHCNFCIRIVPSGALLHTIGIRTIIGIGIGVGQWKHTIRAR